MTDNTSPDGARIKTLDANAVRRVAEGKHADQSRFRRFLMDHRPALGSLLVFVLMIAVFMVGNPAVFTQWSIYRAVLIGLPVVLFVVVPLVYVVTVGEIDLSFPATIGMSGWTFALVVQAGYDPFLGLAAAIVTGMAIGLCVGWLVVYANLSSLIATLGMNFMLRGLIQIRTEGRSIALVSLPKSWAYKIFAGEVFGIPLQVVWVLIFVVICSFIYNRHRFGARVHIVIPKDSLFIEDGKSPYANLLVAREDNKDSPAIKKLAAALTSPEVKKFIEEKYKGAVVPAF